MMMRLDENLSGGAHAPSPEWPSGLLVDGPTPEPRPDEPTQVAYRPAIRPISREDVSIPRVSKTGIAPAPLTVPHEPPRMTYEEIKAEAAANTRFASRTLVFSLRLAQRWRHRRIRRWLTRALHSSVCFALRVDIPAETAIGPGLRIEHAACIVIHPATRIGARCLLRHGVTIGPRFDGETDIPVIGHDVEFGAHAVVAGKVEIADGSRLLPLSLTAPR